MKSLHSVKTKSKQPTYHLHCSIHAKTRHTITYTAVHAKTRQKIGEESVASIRIWSLLIALQKLINSTKIILDLTF